MKKEDLLKLKRALAVLGAGAIMTGCGAKVEENETRNEVYTTSNSMYEELNSTEPKQVGTIVKQEKNSSESVEVPVYLSYNHKYFVELREYALNGLDIYFTNPTQIDGYLCIPDGYKLVGDTAYKAVIYSDEIQSIDLQKTNKVPVINSKGDSVLKYETPRDYELLDDGEYCMKINWEKEKVNQKVK